MIFELFTQAHNESYLLPYMLEFYRKQVGDNEIIFNIYDNGSTDNTIEIANDLGCNVFKSDTNGILDDICLLNFKNNVWKKSKADYIIITDVDEWIDIPYDISNYSIIQCEGWNMVGISNETPNEINNGFRTGFYDKCCLFSPKEIKEINYSPGAHTCNPIGNIILYPMKIKLYHMKYLSEDYIINKYRTFSNTMSQSNLEKGFSKHYTNNQEDKLREIYNRLITEKIFYCEDYNTNREVIKVR